MQSFKQFIHEKQKVNPGQTSDLPKSDRMTNWIRDYIQEFPGRTIDQLIKAGSPKPYSKAALSKAIQTLKKDKFISIKGQKLFWEGLLPEKKTQKLYETRSDAVKESNLRSADGSERCDNCEFFNERSYCTKYHFKPKDDETCDAWKSQETVSENRKRGSATYQQSKGGEVVVAGQRGGKVQGAGPNTARIKMPDGRVVYTAKRNVIGE